MRARLKNRKGAVLVMASVFILGAVTIMAFGMDLSQYYVQANQLQTGADAAAHAGAIEMYLGDSAHVPDTAVAFGQRNKVLRHSATFAKADIHCGTWDPTGMTFTVTGATSTCGAAANAVKVTGRDSRQYVFSALWNLTGLQTTRGAVAWVSPNVVSGACVRPFSIPYWVLTKLLDPTNPDTTRDLTAYDEQQLASLPQSKLTFQLKTSAQNQIAAGNFAAVSIGASGASQYRQNILSCNPTVVGPGTVLSTETGNMVGPTVQGADSLCQPHYANGDCGNGKGGIGVIIKAPLWISATSVNGKTSVTVKIVGTFSLDNVSNKATVTGHWVRSTEAGSIGTTRGTLVRILLVQ